MNTLVLVQHCQSQHHVNRQADLWPDSRNGLTDLGRQQASAAAACLCAALGPTPCRLYASDLTRAWQTAGILGEVLHQPPLAVPELREGCAEAPHPPEDPGAARPGDRVWMLFDSRQGPRMETWREFYQRVVAGMAQIVREHPAECVPIVVTHGGTLSNIVAWWLRLPLDVLPERTPFAASPASISVLKANKFGNPVISRLNDTIHLEAAGLGGDLRLDPQLM